MENEIGEIKGLRDYRELKRVVIFADAFSNVMRKPKYLNVVEMLGLSDKGRDELQGIYSEVIEPLDQKLLSIRSLVIGTRTDHGLGENVAPAIKPTDETKDSAIKEFTDLFSEMLNKDDLKDEINIKAVILYPLVLAGINTWRKFDMDFAGKLIERIKSNEENPELRKAIEIIDIPVVSSRK